MHNSEGMLALETPYSVSGVCGISTFVHKTSYREARAVQANLKEIIWFTNKLFFTSLSGLGKIFWCAFVYVLIMFVLTLKLVWKVEVYLSKTAYGVQWQFSYHINICLDVSQIPVRFMLIQAIIFFGSKNYSGFCWK